MAGTSATHRLFAIVLAAGGARRFGGAKQLADCRGRPLVAHALDAARAVCGPRTVLVTGFDGERVHRAVAPLGGFRAHNSEFEDGLASSIACGVAAVAGSADGVLLLLADQPLVDAAGLRDLERAWRRDPAVIVASAYRDTTGVPAIFPRRSFAELTALSGDVGAKRLLRDAGERLCRVPFAAAAVDVDRPADLDALNAPDG